jgi:oligoribonuclease
MTKEYLLWIDLETTGIDPLSNEILEIAYVITDFSLKTIYHENNYVIRPKIDYDILLQRMDNWCLTQHKKTGLLDKIQTSEYYISDVDDIIINVLNNILPNDVVIYLAGNSVHFDKMFIDRYMIKLSKKISHRILDVSSFAIICKNLNCQIFNKRPLKKYRHTSLSDIWESINEYAYYLDNFINLDTLNEICENGKFS